MHVTFSFLEYLVWSTDLSVRIPQTISPILIIFRVAQGRTWQVDPTKIVSPIANGAEPGQLSSLNFADHDTYSMASLTTLQDARNSESV